MSDHLNIPFNTPSTQSRDLAIGEELAALARHYGSLAAKFLFRGQWAYKEPEWYDHRLHLLDPANHFNDFWAMSADNVIRVLPYNGALLDLCSGDGFYDYWFYARRAKVIAVERDPDTHAHAVKHHSHPNIAYVNSDVLEYVAEPDFHDVVLIRGAIEHFSQPVQRLLFDVAWDTLKPGGWFCGDTPAKRPGQDKQLAAHEHEWADEAEMRKALLETFDEDKMETWTLVSTERTTLFWRCRK